MYFRIKREVFPQGHSESKGAKKRDKSASNGNGKPTRGVATSFGFRRRPASTSRADDNARRKQKSQDKNGNGGESVPYSIGRCST